MRQLVSLGNLSFAYKLSYYMALKDNPEKEAFVSMYEQYLEFCHQSCVCHTYHIFWYSRECSTYVYRSVVLMDEVQTVLFRSSKEGSFQGTVYPSLFGKTFSLPLTASSEEEREVIIWCRGN